MSAPAVAEQLVAETLGAVVLGVLVNSLLFGVVLMQWVSYWGNNFKDSWYIQVLVYWTMFLDTAHTCISWEYIWMYTVRNFGDFDTLVASHWEYDSGPIFIILCALPTQCFLAWRIRKLLERAPYHLGNLLFGMTMTLAVIQGIFGLYMSSSLLIGVTTTAGYLKFVKIAVAWESFAIATDTTIMLSSVGTLLWRRTGFRHTNNLLMNMIIVSVECAIPVTLFTVGHMAGVVASPTTAIHQLFAWSQARLYSNTLFVNLNARAKFRAKTDVSYNSGSRSNDARMAHNNSRMGTASQTRSAANGAVRINVVREEFVMEPTGSQESKWYNPDLKVAPPPQV
ncbi:hypothetical protein C8R43DRAFT_1022196 [Mycena crocata]|nr:hypothetical protein C8R43DRAFT_1022196 [Mycena crocata]